MNFHAYNHTNINLLSQMKLIENRAVWRTLIIHEKAIKLNNEKKKIGYEDDL